MGCCVLCGAETERHGSICLACGRRSSRQLISRRDFLRMAGAAVPAALLGACAPKLATATAPPTEQLPTSTKPSSTKPAPTATADPGPLAPEMVLVEAGSFEMGFADGYPFELPVHRVRLTRPFYIAVSEVTFAQYDLFCRKTATTP